MRGGTEKRVAKPRKRITVGIQRPEIDPHQTVADVLSQTFIRALFNGFVFCGQPGKAGPLLGHFHVGEANRRCPGPGGRFDWAEIGKVLKEINYDGYVVMEPFVTMGGQVGKDISIWRDLSHGATEEMLDRDAADSVAYLRKVMG